jgi:hypothetical protein
MNAYCQYIFSASKHKSRSILLVLSLIAIKHIIPVVNGAMPHEPLFFREGIVQQFTDTQLRLKVEGGSGTNVESFGIAKNARIVDPDVHAGDAVSVTYVKRKTQEILVCLQREPEIDFDEKLPERKSNEHLGVAEMVVPDPEAVRVLNQVGEIEALPPYGHLEHKSEFSSFSGVQGMVVRLRKLSPFQSEMEVRIARDFYNAERSQVFIIDLLTSVQGHLRKGVEVTVSSKDEGGREYAKEVFVSERPNRR